MIFLGISLKILKCCFTIGLAASFHIFSDASFAVILLFDATYHVQKGVAYSGCKIYNHLPPQIKKISNNIGLFKTMLKKFLLQYVFYSVDEYYQQNYNDYDC